MLDLNQVAVDGDRRWADVVLHFIDYEICETLWENGDVWPNQEFVDAYVAAHAVKYANEKFIIN